MQLNTGYNMPQPGIGTFMLMNHTAENAVYEAFKDGYRMIDTARIYGNERGVGKAIQKKFVDEEMRTIDSLDTGRRSASN